MVFKQVSPEMINENFIKSIGSEWMLVTAGNRDRYNMMTASWGFAGVMWGFPAVIAAIRPQRYTMEFMEKAEYFTLSFYGDNKKIHAVCGKESGRDVNKTEKAGLTPLFDEASGAPYFSEARLVLICQKMYVQTLEKDCFLWEDIPNAVYADGDYHRMFYGKIVSALIKE